MKLNQMIIFDMKMAIWKRIRQAQNLKDQNWAVFKSERSGKVDDSFLSPWTLYVQVDADISKFGYVRVRKLAVCGNPDQNYNLLFSHLQSFQFQLFIFLEQILSNLDFISNFTSVNHYGVRLFKLFTCLQSINYRLQLVCCWQITKIYKRLNRCW